VDRDESESGGVAGSTLTLADRRWITFGIGSLVLSLTAYGLTAISKKNGRLIDDRESTQRNRFATDDGAASERPQVRVTAPRW